MKRLLDIICAIFLLFLSFPLILLALTGTLLQGSSSILFTQKRPGKDGMVFSLFKFKTMNDKTDEEGNLLPDEERMTNIGRIIRKMSIDELPQLINVIKGDMSLIGPRPLLLEYLPLYNDFQNRRHEVKPGITGWAQVNGRNMVSWQQRFEFDVYYVDKISFGLDLKIFFMTIGKIVRARGVSADGVATMQKFTGDE